MISRDDAPPLGGWAFTVPQTGARLVALSPATLRDMIKNHLKVNGHEVPDDFRAWFENEICVQGNLEGSVCCEVPPVLPHQVATLEWGHIERFSKVIWNMAKGPEKLQLVPLEEANRRANICAACPLNTSIGLGCKGCRGLLKRVAEAVKNRRVDAQDQIDTCAACGCYLPLKVHVPLDAIIKAESRKRLPYHEGCWRLEPGQSDK